MKKKKFIIATLVIVIIALGSVYIYSKKNLSTNNINNAASKDTAASKENVTSKDTAASKDTSSTDEKPKSDNSVSAPKADYAPVYDVINNYSNIYKNLVNDKSLEMYYFNNVLIKDNPFYKKTVSEVEQYRKDNVKIESYTINVTEVKQKTDNKQVQVTVDEKLILNSSKGNNVQASKKYVYTVQIDGAKNGIIDKSELK